MTSKYAITCLIIVTFCKNFQDGLTDSTTRTEVESELVCTSKWQKLKLNWTSMFPQFSSRNFSSFWRENEKEIKAQTVNKLLQTVIYPYNFSKEIACSGTVTGYEGSLATWESNVSFNVALSQLGTELVGVRFLSIPMSQRRLEFYLRRRTDINQMSYSVKYCSVKDEKLPSIIAPKYTCPNYRTVQFDCSFRENDIYGIQNSAGSICQAQTKEYVNVYSEWKFYIWSTTQNGSTSKSADFRISTKGSIDEPISQYANQGHFTVVVMGRKPGYLLTTTTQQKVRLNWEKTGSTYRMNYSCSNGVYFSETYKQTLLPIYNKSFAPYSLCKFCVESQVSAGSLWSEPICNTSRFPEQLPSKPPTITCNFTTCSITNYPNETRAVTIQFKLPEKTTRNGLLNKLMIKYWNENSTDAFDYVFHGNLSSCEVTLKGLSKSHAYSAQMSACNSKGCSEFSDSVPIATAVHSGKESGKEKKAGKNWLPLLVLLPVAVIVCLVVLAVYYRRRPTRPEESRSFPSIEEPNDYENPHATVGHQPNEYDEMPNADANDNNVDKIENL